MQKMTRGFTQIPNVVLFDADLSPLALRVFAVLSLFVDNDTKKCYPLQSTLEGITGFKRTALYNALKELKERGYIKIEKRKQKGRQGTNNIYDLSPAWNYYQNDAGENAKDDNLQA